MEGKRAQGGPGWDVGHQIYCICKDCAHLVNFAARRLCVSCDWCVWSILTPKHLELRWIPMHMYSTVTSRRTGFSLGAERDRGD